MIEKCKAFRPAGKNGLHHTPECSRCRNPGAVVNVFPWAMRDLRALSIMDWVLCRKLSAPWKRTALSSWSCCVTPTCC